MADKVSKFLDAVRRVFFADKIDSSKGTEILNEIQSVLQLDDATVAKLKKSLSSLLNKAVEIAIFDGDSAITREKLENLCKENKILKSDDIESVITFVIKYRSDEMEAARKKREEADAEPEVFDEIITQTEIDSTTCFPEDHRRKVENQEFINSLRSAKEVMAEMTLEYDLSEEITQQEIDSACSESNSQTPEENAPVQSEPTEKESSSEDEELAFSVDDLFAKTDADPIDALPGNNVEEKSEVPVPATTTEEPQTMSQDELDKLLESELNGGVTEEPKPEPAEPQTMSQDELDKLLAAENAGRPQEEVTTEEPVVVQEDLDPELVSQKELDEAMAAEIAGTTEVEDSELKPSEPEITVSEDITELEKDIEETTAETIITTEELPDEKEFISNELKQLIEKTSKIQADFLSKPPTPEIPELATKRCPYCAEIILHEAIKCKHCHEFLDGRICKEQEQWELIRMAILTLALNTDAGRDLLQSKAFKKLIHPEE